jgi:signal transduction histidine kinase
MTVAPEPGQALERRFSGAWAAFDVFYLAIMFITATVRLGGRDFPGLELTAFVVFSWVPLLARRRFPTAVLAVVVVVEALHIAIGVSVSAHPLANEAMGAFQPVPLATCAAAFTLAVRRPGRSGWRPGIGASLVLLATGLAVHGHTLTATSFVAFDLVVMAVGAGVLVSVRRERIVRDERERLAQIRTEVVAERVRIAQDLHDVLAHHLTLVNAQAGVAGYLLRTDPDAASGALQDIAGNTRRALDELRATVGMLREDGVDEAASMRPAPGLAQLGELLAGFASAGTRVRNRTTGQPAPLTAAADLAAYRIVQEAVTNATKHAPKAPVEVELHWQPSALVLTVENPAPPGFQGPGTRHGLIGMRERAVTVGGSLQAGPTPTGGFLVRATLPVRSTDQEVSA